MVYYTFARFDRVGRNILGGNSLCVAMQGVVGLGLTWGLERTGVMVGWAEIWKTLPLALVQP